MSNQIVSRRKHSDQSENQSGNMKCILCDQPLVNDVQTVSDKCRKTLRKASLERCDSLHSRINMIKNLKLHKKCYCSYNSAGNITAAIKKSKQLNLKRRRYENDFDYHLYCIFCYDDASDAFLLRQIKKPKNKRIAVHKVEKETTLERIDTKAKTLNTKQAHRLSELIKKTNLAELKESQTLPRYHNKCFQQFYQSEPEKPERIKTGNPIVEHVMHFLENHKDECQFSLKSILESYQGEMQSISHVCNMLLKHHEDEIVLFRKPNHEPLICFKNRAADILSQSWYEQRCDNPIEERRRVVLAAANILLEDIRGTPYHTDACPPVTEHYDNANQPVPDTLKLLLDTFCTQNKSGDLSPHYKKSISMAHSLMKTIKPNSFISPIQLGIASLVHEKIGSKDIVNLLSNYGYISSYDESMKFQKSVAPMLNLFNSELAMMNKNQTNKNTNSGDNESGVEEPADKEM